MNLQLMKESIDDTQKKILEKFILHFFEPKNDKRNYRTNEIVYIFSVFHRIFKKYFGFTPNQVDILNAFKDTGFKIYKRTGIIEDNIMHFNKGKIEEVNVFKIPERAKVESYFIDISPLTVSALNRIYKSMPQLKDPEIIKEVREYEVKFDSFISRINE
jgi:hypothetical protein